MLTMPRARSWNRGKTSPSSKDRSESAAETHIKNDSPFAETAADSPAHDETAAAEAEKQIVPDGRFGAKGRRQALPVFRESLQITRRRAAFSEIKLDQFLAARLNDRAIFSARQAVFTCCDLLGRGAAAALDAGGDASTSAQVLRPLVDLARREFGAEHEVTARAACT